MRPCKVLRQSSAQLCRSLPSCRRYPTSRRIAYRRPYSTGQSSQDGTQSGSSTTPAPPVQEPEQGGNEQRPFNVDPVNKTIETAAGELPLSPVMDPSFWGRRTQHREAKGRPKSALNSVERQFRKNPYAQALGTPVRSDSVTRIRLPSFFLQDFNLVQHPETGNPWWMPYSLLKEPVKVRVAPEPEEQSPKELGEDDKSKSIADEIRDGVLEEQEAKEEPNAAEAEDEAAITTTEDEPPSPQPPSPSPPPLTDANTIQEGDDGGKPFGPAAYVLARHELLTSMNMKKSGFTSTLRRLIGSPSSRYSALTTKAIWREDMGALVLERLRRRIADHLLYLAHLVRKNDRHYIVRCYGWGDVPHKVKGAVLWFAEPPADPSAALAGTASAPYTPSSSLSSSSSSEDEDAGTGAGAGAGTKASETGTGKGPGQFATLDTWTVVPQGLKIPTSVAVHNMPVLFGEELAAEIRREARGVFGGDGMNRYDDMMNGSIFMLAGRRTVEAQANLWKLQGYLADYREPPWSWKEEE